jgi:hypothetical protein
VPLIIVAIVESVRSQGRRKSGGQNLQSCTMMGDRRETDCRG